MTRAEDLRLIEEILDEIITDLREGGQGSGHFEHEGIPGHQGGSAPDEGGGQPDWQTQWHKDWEAKLKKWSEEAPKPTPKPERRVYKPSGSKVDLKKVNWDEGDSLDDDDKGAFEDIINPMLDEIKADPDFPEGYCAAVSTWRRRRIESFGHKRPLPVPR